MPLDAQMRDQVLRYAMGECSLDEFRDWFVPRSWDVEQSGNPYAIALAHRIDGILGESSAADWDETGLREELANAIHPFERGLGSGYRLIAIEKDGSAQSFGTALRSFQNKDPNPFSGFSNCYPVPAGVIQAHKSL